jgi:hypothetical protein
MSEMIERVGQAIHGGDCAVGLEFKIEDAREIARAAIEAMREPTEAMAKHGYEDASHTLEGMLGYPSYEESCANIYRAMIDAALGTNPGTEEKAG